MVNENLNLERIKEDEKLIPEKTPKEGGKFEEQKIDFEAEENKNLFQELGDDTKNFVDKLYEGAKMNLIDKPKIMFNSVLLNWHEKKSINLSSKISSNIEEVASWEKLINMHGDRLKSFQEKFGEIPSDVQVKAIEEKRSIETRIEKLKNEKDRLQSKLEFNNNKKVIYENTRKEIVGDVLDRVETKLNPYERRIDNLQNKKEKFDTEIQEFSRRKFDFEKQLQILKEDRETSPFKFERLALKKVIKEIKSELEESDKHIQSRTKERLKIEGKIIHVDKKANYWRDSHNEFARVSQREVVYPKTEEKIKEIPDLKREPITFYKEFSPEERPEEKKESELKSRVEKINPQNYIKEWNKYFGSEFTIDPNSFLKELGFPKKEVNIGEMEEFLKIYSQRYEKRTHRRLSSKNMAKRLKTLRFYLSKKL